MIRWLTMGMVLLTLAACTTGGFIPGYRERPAVENPAQVVVIRQPRNLAHLVYVLVDGEIVGGLSMAEFLRLHLRPGRTIIGIAGASVECPCEGGRTYYFLADFSTKDLFSTEWMIYRIPEKDGQQWMDPRLDVTEQTLWSASMPIMNPQDNPQRHPDRP